MVFHFETIQSHLTVGYLLAPHRFPVLWVEKQRVPTYQNPNGEQIIDDHNLSLSGKRTRIPRLSVGYSAAATRMPPSILFLKGYRCLWFN